MGLLSIADRDFIETHGQEGRRSREASGDGLLSDPWFVNLWLFRRAHAWQLCQGAWPHIEGRAYDQTRMLLPLFDLNAAPIDMRLSLQGAHGWWGPLSDAERTRLDPGASVQISLSDESDYLYRAASFRHYRGSVLRKKANLVRQLDRQCDLLDRPMKPRDLNACLRVVQGWLVDKGKQPGDADDEPCREALANFEPLGLGGQVFEIDGQVVGFLIWQALRADTHVIRFAKARDSLGGQSLKGLYPAMFQRHCLNYPELQWVNFEPDLGLANFRHTKRSFQPHTLLRKWRVRFVQRAGTRP